MCNIKFRGVQFIHLYDVPTLSAKHKNTVKPIYIIKHLYVLGFVIQVPEDEGPVVKYRHGMSEFTDTADHRRKGLNTWQDSPGSIRDY